MVRMMDFVNFYMYCASISNIKYLEMPIKLLLPPTDLEGLRFLKLFIEKGVVFHSAIQRQLVIWHNSILGNISLALPLGVAFMKTITDNFTAYHKPVIPLVNRLRKIVFPRDKPWEREDEKLYS
jgi:hypothetical protein